MRILLLVGPREILYPSQVSFRQRFLKEEARWDGVVGAITEQRFKRKAYADFGVAGDVTELPYLGVFRDWIGDNFDVLRLLVVAPAITLAETEEDIARAEAMVNALQSLAHVSEVEQIGLSAGPDCLRLLNEAGAMARGAQSVFNRMTVLDALSLFRPGSPPLDAVLYNFTATVMKSLVNSALASAPVELASTDKLVNDLLKKGVRVKPGADLASLSRLGARLVDSALLGSR